MPEPGVPLNQIFVGDCIPILETLPEKSVDLIFADPPYNLQLQRELLRPNQTKVDAVKDEWDRFESFQAYDAFTRAWMEACRRVLKDEGTLWVIGSYHNIYRMGSTLMDLGYWILNDVVWVKQNPMPQFRGVRFTNAHETLIWAQKHQGARYTFNYQAMKALNGDLQMRSDWSLPICTGRERLRVDGKKAHSTQKPESLLYRVIQACTNPGDVVLDPFFGTGTTGAVAKKLHRSWIGIEQDERYVKVARERLAAVEPGEYVEEVFAVPDRRGKARVPFGVLLERGLLRPGQRLYYNENPRMSAMILASGHLKFREHTGSIHQVSKAIKGGTSNGWLQWYYHDAGSNRMVLIEQLRRQVRAEAASEAAEEDA